MAELTDSLAAPFDPAIVSWRLGPTNRDKTKGMALAYIDARDVMRRLDEACGAEGWQDEYPWSDGKRVVCRIGIKIDDEWIWKTDGAGDSDMEGEKGALSDAFKRAAVKWGIGRYLYDVDSPWVEIAQRGNSYIIVESEYAKLRARLPRAAKQQTEVAKPEPPRRPGTAERERQWSGGRPLAAAEPAPRERDATSTASSPTPSDIGNGHDGPAADVASLRAKRDHIIEGINTAATPTDIDRVLANNGVDLALIKQSYGKTYETIMGAANARRNELLSEA